MSRFVLALLVAGCSTGDSPSKGDDDDDVVDPIDDDQDDDGFVADDDCDDTRASVHPDALEVPYDGIDQDCADGDLVDVDKDGFDALEADGDDCDDTDAGIHPGLEDIPYDDIDQDCSGADLTDLDGDGAGSDDCNDDDPTIFPDAEEVFYDGIDQDCREDCDYDADHDDAVPAEWIGSVVDGDACDRDPGAEIGVLEDCNDRDRDASTQEVDTVDPPDGAVDVDAMGQIRVVLRDNEMTAELHLTDPSGAAVPSYWYNETADTLVLQVYDPITGNSPYPLAGFTTYTLEIVHSCGTESTTFTTGEGLRPVDPSEIIGVTWALNPWMLSYPCFTVLNYFSFSNFAFVAVTASDGATIDLLVAAPDAAGNQDLCVPTGEVLGVDFSNNPQFDAGAFDYPVAYSGGAGVLVFPHQQGSLTGTIYQGQLLAPTLIGVVDTHEVTAAAGVAQNAVCNMFGCINCPDGSGQHCYEETYWLSGLMQPTQVQIVPRTAADIAADAANCPP